MRDQSNMGNGWDVAFTRKSIYNYYTYYESVAYDWLLWNLPSYIQFSSMLHMNVRKGPWLINSTCPANQGCKL